ncbi:MAG: adenosylmethionine decarboxylase [Elusimicrobia bacterium]|nr:adenosylmethionine decarboxylase [Elusimicrobiota bacterium]
MKALGQHLVVELYGCDYKIISEVNKVQSIMMEAAKAAGVTIIDAIFHRFEPQGVSGVIVIAESHFAIHTWPEYEYSSIDFYTCGRKTRPWKALKIVKKGFKSTHFSVMKMERGLLI